MKPREGKMNGFCIRRAFRPPVWIAAAVLAFVVLPGAGPSPTILAQTERYQRPADLSSAPTIPPGWAQTYNTFFQGYRWEDGYSQVDDCAGIQPSGDGGVVIAATVSLNGPGKGQEDAVVMKIRPSGVVDWKIRYDCDPSRDYRSSTARSLVRTQDGQFLLLGVLENRSILAMRISDNGAVLWLKSYSFGDGSVGQGITAAAATCDGGCAVAGSADDGDNWILRLATNGDVLWHKHFDFFPRTLKTTADDGFIVTAEAGDKAMGARFDSTGNLKWSRTYIDNTRWDCDDMTSVGIDIIPIENGNFLLAGITYGCTCCNHGDRVSWLAKLDGSGRVLKSRAYGPDFSTVWRSKGRGYILQSIQDFIRIDESGAPVWDAYFEDVLFGLFFQTKEGVVVALGQHYPEAGLIVLGLDPQGRMGGACTLARRLPVSSGRGFVKSVSKFPVKFHEATVSVFQLIYFEYPWTFESQRVCGPIE